MEQQNPKFTALLKSLEGKEIANVAAADENGIMMFEFAGGKEMFIHCAWRLSQNGVVLGTWNDELDEEELNPPVVRLEGVAVTGVEVNELFDLKITFDKDYRLDVFADLYTEEEITEYEENWSVCDVEGNVCFVVTENFALLETKYDSNA